MCAENRVILRTEGLYKSFGGVVAVNDVSLVINEGELTAIIGPNGAGKTTLFNLITGQYRPDRGRMIFKGRDISQFPAYRLSRMGIGRSFQRTSLFLSMSVLENIMVALFAHRGQTSNFYSSVKARGAITEEALKILETIGLKELASNATGTLSHGDQRRLEIGIALAGEPVLLLFDEPTAGMSIEETEVTVELIKMLSQVDGRAVLFTEHDMDVVFYAATYIRVLSMGRIIAEGTPEEISKNEEVIRVYLGEEKV
jgi:branched-chain amino acid transport system ATP-binding protein